VGYVVGGFRVGEFCVGYSVGYAAGGFCVGNFVGCAVGGSVGAPVGEGNASAQERQHIRETESKEHRVVKSRRTAHSQDLFMPNSAIKNIPKPAASPVQEEQQL